MTVSGKNVLVVEDSATMRSFVVAALEADDFEVTTAKSGFEAMKVLAQRKFDLVITDINMPDINGLELVSFVRRNAAYRAIPLLIISTEGSERDRLRGLELGADAYLVKPFELDALRRTARELLAKAREE